MVTDMLLRGSGEGIGRRVVFSVCRVPPFNELVCLLPKPTNFTRTGCQPNSRTVVRTGSVHFLV
eukprot:394113-Rhodomonas_salina.1